MSKKRAKHTIEKPHPSFTPGPWELTSVREIGKTGEDWASIAIACNPRPADGNSSKDGERLGMSNPRFEEGCANARLIACAPEILEALIDLLDAYNATSTETGETGAALRAKAIIAKAMGATQP